MTEMIQLETHPSVILKVRADVAHRCRVCTECRGTGREWFSARLPSCIVSEALPCLSCQGEGNFWSVIAPAPGDGK